MRALAGGPNKTTYGASTVRALASSGIGCVACVRCMSGRAVGVAARNEVTPVTITIELLHDAATRWGRAGADVWHDPETLQIKASELGPECTQWSWIARWLAGWAGAWDRTGRLTVAASPDWLLVDVPRVDVVPPTPVYLVRLPPGVLLRARGGFEHVHHVMVIADHGLWSWLAPGRTCELTSRCRSLAFMRRGLYDRHAEASDFDDASDEPLHQQLCRVVLRAALEAGL